MAFNKHATGQPSDPDKLVPCHLIDNLHISTGLRYLKSEIGNEFEGMPRPYRYGQAAFLQGGIGDSNSDTVSEFSDATSDASDATSTLVNNPLEFKDLPAEIRNKIFEKYARDTENLPAGDIEVGRNISGNYIYPQRSVPFNLKVLLVSRAWHHEALPFIIDELATRRFILTDHDGGVLQSRVEQNMLRVFGDAMQTVTLRRGGMINVLSALGGRKLKILDIDCNSHRVYRKVAVRHELDEEDWTKDLVATVLADNCKEFLQIFVDNSQGVQMILAGYAGAVAAYPRVFAPGREWMVRFEVPVMLELAEGDDKEWDWSWKIWVEGGSGRVVEYERSY